jgi:hypothetical protein
VRSILQWLRLVAPPGWILAGAIAFSFICSVLYLICGWRFDSWDMTRQFLAPRDAAIGLAAAAIGVLRVTSKHPLFQPIYCGWLSLTPWNRTKPLPLGPIALVPQDFLFVCLLMLLVAYRPLAPVLTVPGLFLAAYLATLALALALTGERWVTFAMVFGLGLAVRLATWSPGAALACLVSIYLVGWLGVWRSLADFPWRNAAGVTPTVKSLLNQPDRLDWQRDIGFTEINMTWPFNRLHYKLTARSIGPVDAVAIALLVGWWAYALFAPFLETEPIGWLFYAGLVGMCVGGRLIVYLAGHAPPISEWGRLWTLRWIIPAYDCVFVVPIVTFFVGALLPLGLRLVGSPAGVTIGLAASAVLLIAFLGPPRLRRWQLTAPARLVAWPRQRQVVAEI